MSLLQQQGKLKIDNDTLYTSAELKLMLPRTLYLAISRECRGPAKGFFYGRAINEALERIFLNSPDPKPVPLTHSPLKRDKTGKDSRNGRSTRSQKVWFSIPKKEAGK